MKTLSIQLQPERVKLPNVDEVVQQLCDKATQFGAEVSVAAGEDIVRYININMNTDCVPELWQKLKSEFAINPLLAHCTIVCCEGKNGWDDYLLLYHFDSTLILDAV
jgi:hypothetical protein